MATEDTETKKTKKSEASEAEASKDEAEAKGEEAEAETDKAEDKAEEPAAEAEEEGEGEQAADEGRPGVETQQMMDEIEEGWPRSWIVTAAVVGIIAIIVVARLVGQTWRTEPVKPPPPQAEPAAKKAGAPGEPAPEPKQPPKDPDQPPTQAKRPEEIKGEVLIKGEKVSLPPGLQCLTKDGKFIKMGDLATKPKECVVEVPLPTHLRVDIERSKDIELNVMVVPGVGDNPPVIASGFFAPFEAKSYWLGLSQGELANPSVVVVAQHPMEQAAELASIKLIATADFKPGVVDPGFSVSYKDVTVEKAGNYCIAPKTNKAVKWADKAPLPKECRVDFAGANTFDVELLVEGTLLPLQIFLVTDSKELPPILETHLVPFADQDKAFMHRFALKTSPSAGGAFRFSLGEDVKLTFKSITIKGQHQP